MRKILLASVGAIALFGVGAATMAGGAIAAAQVFDYAASVKWLEQMKHNAKVEIHNISTAIRDAKAAVVRDLHLVEAMKIYRTGDLLYREANAITNISNMSEALGYAQTRVPLPHEVWDVAGMMTGMGSGGPLASQVVRFVDQNVAYMPTAPDYQAHRIRANATSTAGQMAIAQVSYEAANNRMQGAADLQERLGSARTAAEKADLAARAAIEQNRAIAQGNQLLALQIWQQAQRDAAQQEQEQNRRLAVERMIEDADGVIASGGRRTSPAPQMVAFR